MDLSRISDGPMEIILQKMCLPALINIRKTNTYLDKFVDKNGYRIAVGKIESDPSLILRISSSPKEKTTENEQKEFELSFAVARYKWTSTYYWNTRVMGLPENSYQSVTDPVKQLSGVYFEYIFIVHNKNEENLTNKDEIASNNEKKLAVFKNLPAVLKRIKPKCDFLKVHSPLDEIPSFWQETQKLIQMKTLHYYSYCTTEQMQKWSFPENTFISINNIGNVHKKLPPAFRFLKRASLCYGDGPDVLSVKRLIKEYLMDVIRDRSVRGRLEVLKITKWEFQPFENFPGMTEIWRGVHTVPGYVNEPAIISKLEIDGGFAYLLLEKGYNIYFYDRECDQKAVADIVYMRELSEKPINNENN